MPSELKTLSFNTCDEMLSAIAVLTSSTFFWFFNVLSDCRNLNRREILAFPLNPRELHTAELLRLAQAGRAYLAALHQTSKKMIKSGLHIETLDGAKCKSKVDEIDRYLARHYGFTDEELDFIVNYDIKYRMGGTDGALEQ